MKRSELLESAGAVAIIAAGLPEVVQASSVHENIVRLTAPADGVPIAFLLSDQAVMIDFTGPWEVFQDAQVVSRSGPAFTLYTVAESTNPLTVSGGAKIIPQFDFANAPMPKVVVVPGQSPATAAVKSWLRRAATDADVVMSVCTGAFVLAETGLLNGRTVTTHHGSFSTLAMEYPQLTVKRGARFVDEGHVATSGGLTAGMDLAMHVVERYYGHEAARQTAYYMEYLSPGWSDSRANMAYAKPPAPKPGDALCPVCWMDVNPKIAVSSTYKGRPYYFCMPDHKRRFDTSPARFL